MAVKVLCQKSLMTILAACFPCSYDLSQIQMHLYFMDLDVQVVFWKRIASKMTQTSVYHWSIEGNDPLNAQDFSIGLLHINLLTV